MLDVNAATGMAQGNAFRALADCYLAARRAHEEAAAAEKRAKAARDVAEADLVDAMTNCDTQSFKTGDGVSFSLMRKTVYNCPAEHKEDLMDALRAQRMEYLFTVNPQTLNKAMAEEAGEHEGELPEPFASLLNPYEKVTVSVRGYK